MSSQDSGQVADNPHAALHQHVGRIIAALRDRLVDLSRRNRLLNYRHSESSNTHIRIVDHSLPDLIEAVSSNRRLEFRALPEPVRALDDEDTDEFKSAYETARLSDPEYLEAVQRLDDQGSDDPDNQSSIDQALGDQVRSQLGFHLRKSQDELRLQQ